MFSSPSTARGAAAAIVLLAAVVYFHRLGDVPVYVSTDEAKFAVQAHSLATTGRDLRGNRLPLFMLIVDPLQPEAHSVAWWQPTLFYAMAAVFKVTEVSPWSTRIPVTTLAVLNVWLIYIVTRRWLKSVPLGLFAAAALALTPSHFILGREAADYFCPVTVGLLWLWCVLKLIEQPGVQAATLTGLVLGAGLYTYITSWVVMPMLVALTIGLAWRQRIPLRLMIWTVGVFSALALPAVIWVASHPSMLGDTLTHYHFSGGSRLIERITLYWDYTNPSYLFFAGASSLLWSTRMAGVFLLTFIVLLPLGIWHLAVERRDRYGSLLVIVFLLVPLPIVLAMPEAPFYATARAILAVPFGVLIATAGFGRIIENASAFRLAIAGVLIIAMPLQFRAFHRDYFDEYPARSALWIDAMNFKGVADHVIAADQAAHSTPIYLSHDDIGEDKAVKWKFHLLAQGRLDLWERSRYLEPESAAGPIEAGSVLMLSASNARVERLQREGWSLETIVADAAGTPVTALLRRNPITK